VSEVQPVQVANTEPIAVTSDRPPATTAQEEQTALISYGQRRVNLIWEVTQASIAIAVSLVTLGVAAVLVLRGDTSTGYGLLLSNAFFLVIGFYFGRTNHQKTGGVGPSEIGR
jgi:hypothetical protein